MDKQPSPKQQAVESSQKPSFTTLSVYSPCAIICSVFVMVNLLAFIGSANNYYESSKWTLLDFNEPTVSSFLNWKMLTAAQRQLQQPSIDQSYALTIMFEVREGSLFDDETYPKVQEVLAQVTNDQAWADWCGLGSNGCVLPEVLSYFSQVTPSKAAALIETELDEFMDVFSTKKPRGYFVAGNLPKRAKLTFNFRQNADE
mmetsp:Transcript_37573/g.57557  ORF Transcript_37573/g.57557 Transcript_37573/m.57557 type:complete len:201 (+) Transcript_37573:17-619(+)